MEQESCNNCLYKNLGEEDECETRFWLNAAANIKFDSSKCILYRSEDYKDELAIAESLEFTD